MIYGEQLHAGKWSPVLFDTMPETATINGKQRLKRSDGTGAEIRALKPVQREHENFMLEKLRLIYGVIVNG